MEGQRACGQCGKPIERDFLPSLPCGHLYCMNCVDTMTRDRRRSWSLPCPADGCLARFAIPLAALPDCRLTPSVQPPFVGDRYAADVTRRATVERPSADAAAATGGRTKIMGMALLNDSLFVVSGKRNVLEYNVANLDRVSCPDVHVIPELKWPRGMAASRHLGALYITDWQRMFGGSLWRYKPPPPRPPRRTDDQQDDSADVLDDSAAAAAATAAAARVDFDGEPYGVSVSDPTPNATGSSVVRDDVTLLVTCATPMMTDQRIVVYRDDGGGGAGGGGEGLRVVATLTLPAAFQTPRHSLLLSSGEYVVCHGWTAFRQHRVSKLQLRAGQLDEVAAYGTRGGSGDQQVRCPLSLCVDEDGLLLVVDYYNHRVQLVTAHLQLVRHLVTGAQHSIRYPRHVALDQRRGLLYVAQQNGSVHIFQVR